MALELNNMQGLLIRGFGNLQGAQYVMLNFSDAVQAKGYLKELLPLITPGDEKPTDHALQVAFTYEGISFLQMPAEGLESFSREFKEGMTEPHRQFVLGDSGDNDPKNWEWGSPEQEIIHMLLMVFSETKETLAEKLITEKGRIDKYGVNILHSLPSGFLKNSKEHFGFRDDISRPIIEELVDNPEKITGFTFPAGEFIMGYKNLYDEFSPAPKLPKEFDANDSLPLCPEEPGLKDFGKNGTYLIFRQLEQDVFSFWKFLKNQSKSEEEAIKIASKMVGRWPDGSPLTLCPVKNDPELSVSNDFGFWEEDKAGLKCPIGSHIRRTNPRDHLVTEKTKKDSAEMASKHRMIRKGRPYGNPVTDDLNPMDLMMLARDNEKRGLHFICLVTDIRRQFEFVQNNWVNFHKFGGLDHDGDPIIGNHSQNSGVITNEFSIPDYPIKRKIQNLPNFTITKGGSYFFIPGLKAIQFLANHE